MLSLFPPRFICTTAAVALSIETSLFGGALQAGSDPFESLAPWVVVSEGDSARLDRDQVLARVLTGKDGQLAVFVATRLNAPPDALVAWTRAIAELKRSRFVLAIGRFLIRRARPTSNNSQLMNAWMRFDDAVPATVGSGCRPGT